jgi:predicted O-methyltransferase YrrM
VGVEVGLRARRSRERQRDAGRDLKPTCARPAKEGLDTLVGVAEYDPFIEEPRLPLRARVAALGRRLGVSGPPPVSARHVELSAISSADDDVAPSARLLEVALAAVDRARSVDLIALDARLPPEAPMASTWPGEHYRLLTALVAGLQPSLVIEIGTATGLSALAMRHGLPDGGRIVTYDIVPWQRFSGTVLREEDLADGRIEQRVEDLTDPAVGARSRELLEQADLLFVDAAKDGRQEAQFLDIFERLRFRGAPIAVFDDIRVWNMLSTWRGVRRPKLDLTSFGHWSGTGLVDYAS